MEGSAEAEEGNRGSRRTGEPPSPVHGGKRAVVCSWREARRRFRGTSHPGIDSAMPSTSGIDGAMPSTAAGRGA